MLVGILLILSLSNALLTIHPPGRPPVNYTYQEGDFCTSAPRLTNVDIVYVENTQGPCDNISFPSTPSIAGKIVVTPLSSCTNCCSVPSFVRALQQAGAIGFLADNVAAIRSTSAVTTQKGLFCFGVPLSFNIIGWLTAGGNVTADVFQPSMNSNHYTFLRDLHMQTPAPVWDLNLDPCSGTADRPPSRVPWKGVTCDQNGLLTQLNIPFAVGPTGRLPDSFCVATALTTLTIQDDASFVSLQFCSNLTKLSTLTISGTGLRQIDPRVFSLKISQLDLSNNQLAEELNLATWVTSYRTITLRGNRFYGTLPSMANFTLLGVLNLGQNLLSGQIPDLSLITRLVKLDLSDNQFTNVTSPTGTSLSTVTSVRLSYNQLTIIPDLFISNLVSITELYLDHNQLTSIPGINANAGLALTVLDISSNHITGVVDIIGPSMVTCLASSNSITGLNAVFSDTSFYGTLQKLDLTDNNVSGSFDLPFSLIQYLYMRNNKVTSFAFSNYRTLVTADFSDNAFSGDLSSAAVIGPGLYSLDFTNNNFTGFVQNSLFSTIVQLRLAGNPGLNHGASTLLPARVLFTWDITQTFNYLNMECPTYSIQDVLQSEFTIDPSYHDNKLCRCLPNFFREPNKDHCSPCLPNAICPGKEDPLSVENNANILAKFGYFPLPNPENPTLFIPCRFGVILVNDPLNPCNPDVNDFVTESQNSERNTSVAATRFQCSVGYTDRLCSRCEAGWFRKEGRCLICNGRPEYPLFLIAIVCIFLGACTFFAYRPPVDMSTTSINPDGWTFEPKQRVYDFVPLILHFFQVSTIILVKLQSLDVVQTMNSLLVTASFSTPQSGIGFECGLPAFQGFVTQYLAVVIFPPMLAIVLAGFFSVRIIYRFSKKETQNWSLHLYQYLYGLFSMLEAIHFPLVTYVLGVFQCTQDPVSGISYFTDHPYLLCSSISPAGKVFPLLLYPIGLVGFFVCLGVYLHYAPSDVKESEPIIQSFAFFYIRFKPDRVASGVFFIFLNFGLSLVVGLMEPNNDVFPTAIVLLLILDFFFVTVFQPYLQPRYNKVRTVNDLVALLLFVNNLIYSSGDQFPGRSASPAVVYVTLNLGMIGFYAYHLYRIVKIHKTDLRLMRANSGVVDPHHRGDGRKHIELGELKSRKHTNIDPPSTSHGETPTHTGHGGTGGTSHVYVPVTTNPPVSTDTAEASVHSPLPIISEHETNDFGASSKTTGDGGSSGNGLVFTENPLAETGSAFSGETPPSPSSKE